MQSSVNYLPVITTHNHKNNTANDPPIDPYDITPNTVLYSTQTLNLTASSIMPFFSKLTKKNTTSTPDNMEQQQRQKPSMRDLQARALATWDSPTYSSAAAKAQRRGDSIDASSQHKSSFDQARAMRRASASYQHDLMLRH